MKYLYTLILVFFLQATYSQSYESIIKLDTIYIPYRIAEYNSKFDYPEDKNGFKNRSYFFNYKKNGADILRFEFDRNKTMENRRVKKAFFRINKGKVVEIDSLKGIDYQDIACNLFNHSKVIYVVDFSEVKGRSVKLYRVISLNLCYAIE
jgi:hypothetical protein